jgi:hypothetical protein
MPAKTKGRPSERDQFWLDHQVAQASSGQSAKQYAAAHELSPHAFYQARKRLRAMGLLEPAQSSPKPRGSKSNRQKVSFSKIAVTKAAPESRFRLELPGGFVLEWDGGEVPSSVASLLERLTARP